MDLRERGREREISGEWEEEGGRLREGDRDKKERETLMWVEHWTCNPSVYGTTL